MTGTLDLAPPAGPRSRPGAAMRVRLLGEQVLAGVDGTIAARSSRTIALIAFLVAHGDAPQTRQRIAAAFWPDSTDEQALTNLRRELHHLRGVLGEEPALAVTPRDLAWHDSPTCDVDVRAFRADRAAALVAAAAGDRDAFLARATAAVARYGGEFLPGNDDDWARDTRAELEQQCVDLLDRCVAAHREGDDPGRAVEAARRRVALRPLEEAGYRTLIELHGDLGDRAGAVSAYHHCASILERELGIEPDPLTRTTLNRLLARSGPAVAAPPEPPAPRTVRGSGRFVGRARELGILRDRWRAAAEGGAGLVVLRGDPGVGKSRLMAELADEARRAGAVVADAQCFGTSGRLALAPVADWLRTPAVRAALPSVDPVWCAEVERLLPPARGRSEPVRPMVDAWQRHRFFEGLSRALLAVDRPLVLTVDNVQWCDPETLAFVTFCLGLATDEPVLVVATMRDDHDPALGAWVVRMRATGRLTEIALDPFEVADTAALAESVSGTALTGAEADLLHATTGGFPLYIVEAGRADTSPPDAGTPSARPPGTDQLVPVLQSRLVQVSEQARAVAGLAAAVGRDVTLDLLTEAADLPADAVVRAVDELWRSRILRDVGGGYDFSHDLLRDAAYAAVSPPQRWLLHRRVAQGLELLHADDPDAVSAQLAEQYARGGRADRAVENYRRAAAVASSMFGHDEAVRLLEAALEIVRAMPAGRDRTGRELDLVESLTRTLYARNGPASPVVRDTLQRSIALADALGRRDSALDALVGLWSSQFVHGDTAVAHRTATRALEMVPPGSPVRGPAHFGFAGSAASLGLLAESVEHFALAAEYGGEHALTIGTRTEVHGPAWAAHVHWLLGRPDEALEHATGAIARARSGDSAHQLAVALAYGAVTHQLRGDVPELRRVVDELGELCRRYSLAYYREWALVLDGWSRDDGTGSAVARRGVEALTADGAFARMPYWLSLCADVAQREGRPDAARATLDAALAGGRARDDLWWLPEVMRMRAAHDDGDCAVSRLQDAARLAVRHGSTALLARCRADLAARGAAAAAPAGPSRGRG